MADVIEGVVVGDFQDTDLSGFFVQEANSPTDGDATTSEGTFVYSTRVDLDLDDVVRLKGDVTEYYDLTEINNVDELVACSSSATIPLM